MYFTLLAVSREFFRAVSIRTVNKIYAERQERSVSDQMGRSFGRFPEFDQADELRR